MFIGVNRLHIPESKLELVVLSLVAIFIVLNCFVASKDADFLLRSNTNQVMISGRRRFWMPSTFITFII